MIAGETRLAVNRVDELFVPKPALGDVKDVDQVNHWKHQSQLEFHRMSIKLDDRLGKSTAPVLYLLASVDEQKWPKVVAENPSFQNLPRP